MTHEKDMNTYKVCEIHQTLNNLPISHVDDASWCIKEWDEWMQAKVILVIEMGFQEAASWPTTI